MRLIGLPTNLVVGPHRAAKRRVIERLLAGRPEERWALLDNDGLTGEPLLSPGNSVKVTAVSDACVCCAGPVLRVALTRLLREARPQRLLIAPASQAATGPVRRLLGDRWLAPVLDLRATVLVLDARENAHALAPGKMGGEFLSEVDVVLVDSDIHAQESASELLRRLSCLQPGSKAVAISDGQVEFDLLDRPGRRPPKGVFAGDGEA